MSNTIDVAAVAPEAIGPFREAGKLVAQSGLEPELLELVRLRASQLNGCAFCLALHTRVAHALGENSDRIALLPAWREAPWYSARERAALEWAEALTLISKGHPRADLLAQLKEHFSEKEIVYLTLAVTIINSFNRISIGFGASPAAADEMFKMLHPELAAAQV